MNMQYMHLTFEVSNPLTSSRLTLLQLANMASMSVVRDVSNGAASMNVALVKPLNI